MNLIDTSRNCRSKRCLNSTCREWDPTSVTGELGIAGIGSLTRGLNFAIHDSKIMFWYTDLTVIEAGTVSTNNWYHICGVAEALLEISIYVNGVPVVSKASSGSGGVDYTLSGTTRLIIGQERDLISGRYFPGIIDDVAIWKRSLSVSDISNLYNSQK